MRNRILLAPLALVLVAPFALSVSPSHAAWSDIRVNAGGTALTDGGGYPWVASTGFVGGRKGTSANPNVPGGLNKVYSTDWVFASGFNQKLANGTYRVRVLSVESHHSSPGKRIFSVTAEGKTMVSDVDLVARGGKGVPQILDFTVPVADGELSLGFPAKVDTSTISGIIISQAPTSTTTPKPTTTVTPTPTASPTPTSTLPSITSVTTNGFNHPGVLNSASSLSSMRSAVLKGGTTEKASYDQMKASRFASLSWTPKPTAYVGCGSNSVPDEGCTQETDDAQAAYTHALMWYVTGNKAHAAKAKEILNAYSGTLKDHKFDTKVYKNGLLQAGWAGATFTKAAEIIRYSNAGWSASDVARFEGMLKTAFLPRVINGWTWTSSNWQLTMAETTMSIGVFTNDRATWDNGVGDWRNHVKSTFYMATDGSKPNFPASTIMKDSNYMEYWSNPTKFTSGIAAETCRDASHMAMALGSALSGAETARIQGVDLYGEQQSRLVTTMEFNAKYINNPSAAGWPCPKPLNLGGVAYKYTWSVGYQHYADRQGRSLPETAKLIKTIAPTKSGLHLNWESLTHSAF